MVKLVDTLVSGTSDLKVVQVRVLFRAQKDLSNISLTGLFVWYPCISRIMLKRNHAQKLRRRDKSLNFAVN
jgi:hypothetical protein